MADVTIRGAGIFGLSIAWACVRRGARVVVVDPYGPGAGSSGGLVGALEPHVPENWNEKKAFQLESLLMAEAFWAGVEQAGGVSAGYARSGRVQPLADDHAVVIARERASGAAALWQGRAEWAVVPADGPFAPPSPTGLMVHDTLTARLHPRRACAALVAALKAHGATIETDAPDRGAVLHATGAAGLLEMNAALDQSNGAAIKGQAALFALDMRDAPQVFVEGLHIVPHADGTTAVGSTSEREYDDPKATDALLEDVITRARAAFAPLDGVPVIDRWAGLRPRARSRAPMLGSHPLYPDQFIANGGFKIGFGMAPKIADVMADLMLDNHDTIPDGFRPEASIRKGTPQCA